MDETRRDRDIEGRAHNARPRDGLGRPLPYGTAGVERQPEGVVRTPEETVREAQRLLDAGMPFHAHEVFEDAWKSGPDAERELWRGLAQLAVGLTHAARGNATGGARLLRRGAAALTEFAASGGAGEGRAGAGRAGEGGAGEGGAGEGRAGEGRAGEGGGTPVVTAYGIGIGPLSGWALALAARVEDAGAPVVDAAAEAPRLRADS